MTDSSPLLDPEVEAILREVAKDPDSVLLRVDRPKELRVLVEGGDTVVRGKTGLSLAEKQLLEVHRDEAAYLLRLAYYRLSERTALAREGGLIFRPERGRPKHLGEAELRNRILQEREALAEDAEAHGALDGGHAALLSTAPRPIDLAIASIRLAPSLLAQSYVASEYLIQHHWQSASLTYATLTDRTRDPVLRADFTTGYALALARIGKLGESREVLRCAAEVVPDHECALCWLFSSIQTEQLEQAREAAMIVDNIWPAPNLEARGWLSALLRQKTEGDWVLNPAGRSLIRTLEDSVGETSRLILHGMAMESR